MLDLAKDILMRPSQAIAKILSDPSCFKKALGLYAIYLLACVIFYALKPADFPPGTLDFPKPEIPTGWIFSIQAQAWEPFLAALGIALTGWFARVLQGGRLPARILIAVACLLAPLALIFAYRQTFMPSWMFGICGLGLLAALIPGLRTIHSVQWRQLACLLLSINVIALSFLPLLTTSVLLRSPLAYTILETIAMLWMLGLAAFGVGKLRGLYTARAFCAVFLAVCGQAIIIFFLYLMGILSETVRNALLWT